MEDTNNLSLIETVITHTSSMASIASIPLTLYIAKLELSRKKEETKREIIQTLMSRISKSSLDFDEFFNIISSILENNNISNKSLRLLDIHSNFVLEISRNSFISEKKRSQVLSNLKDLGEQIKQKLDMKTGVARAYGHMTSGNGKHTTYSESRSVSFSSNYSYLFNSRKTSLLPSKIIHYFISWILGSAFSILFDFEIFNKILGILTITSIYLLIIGKVENGLPKNTRKQ
ncbi:hypothetical protein SAMN04489724_2903 [Algoriphagus locisalis]|uniref:Uncharacterized protein n=1 Tax=Algoriphagus locisalis TaxID=305507 RepID=A0A1I7C694_9BACT|nr:hypothetical protein [Algoriphagus locisalis]SFT94961.1 hypothetical protein SAMN04489724_2903 [Algoriphagus locisalis]